MTIDKNDLLDTLLVVSELLDNNQVKDAILSLNIILGILGADIKNEDK